MRVEDENAMSEARPRRPAHDRRTAPPATGTFAPDSPPDEDGSLAIGLLMAVLVLLALLVIAIAMSL